MDNETTEQRRKGIYLLPNLFTTAALFAGFFSVISAINGQFSSAAIAIFLAMVLDGLDGRVARMTHTESEFGAQYDSLADMLSFGVAPALVVYLWGLSTLGKLGWLMAFIYTAGAALRLARFNTQVGIADKRYFQGLPSPASAAVIAGMVWVAVDYELSGDALPMELRMLAALLTALAGLLMVSNIRYHSFKDLNLKDRIPFVAMILMVALMVLISVDPPQVLFGGFLIYALWGPIFNLLELRKRQAKRQAREKNSPMPEGNCGATTDLDNRDAEKTEEAVEREL